MRALPVAVVAALAFLQSCSCGGPAGACKTTADCSDPAAPHCAPMLGACVACLDDTMCPVGQVCNVSGQCQAGCDGTSCTMGLVCNADAGACVGCLTNANCATAQLPLCNPATQTCVGCLSATDCHDPLHPVCDPTSNSCVACITDANCPAGQVCNATSCVPGCTATHGCPTGAVCGPRGTCVQCAGDADCSGLTPRCDTGTNHCVACLPGANDNCPMGQYCRPDFVCERGCKTNTDCPSGMCVNHSCTMCTGDAQCAAGNICTNGSCVPGCSATNPCGAGQDCCSGHCENLQTDPNNCGVCGTTCGAGATCCGASCKALNTVTDCGTCGNACAAGQGCCGTSCATLNTKTNCGACGTVCGTDQFCDGTTCRNQTFPEFCANKNVYAITDGIALDTAATGVLASTIQQYCSSTTMIQTGPQTTAAWVDQTTGQLLLGGGTTVVTAGGPFPNKPVKWLERTQQVTKVYFETNGLNTYYFKKRSDASVLVTELATWCNPSRDVFVVELASDPTSGTLVLMTYGLCSGAGTATGAWYWANTMLPNRMMYTNSWYIYQWDDTNPNGTADMNDTFTPLATGL